MRDRLLHPLFVALAVAGVVTALLLTGETFPAATVDLSVGRAEAERRALAFLDERGVEAAGRWRSLSFETDPAQDYLTASVGLGELQALAARDLNLARWRVRLFTPLDPETWEVEVSSRTGRILGYRHTLREEAPGAALSYDAARDLALSAVLSADPPVLSTTGVLANAAPPSTLKPQHSRLDSQDSGLTTQASRLKTHASRLSTQHSALSTQHSALSTQDSRLTLLSHAATERPGRLDHRFVWEAPGLRRGEATYRLAVTVQGDKMGAVQEYYHLPASWGRLESWHYRRGALLSWVGWTLTMALTAGLGVAWLWAAGQGLLRLRFAAVTLSAVAFVGAATALNSLPLLLRDYPTNTSVTAYLLRELTGYGGTFVTVAGAIVLGGMAGEALLRRESGGRVSLSRLLTADGLASRPAARAVLVGACVGAAQLGYVTLFYWAGRRWLGVWYPVFPQYSDLLSTPLPWLYALAIGLLPAAAEELLFRLGGITLLRRATGMPRLAVVVTAVVWAALHATYAQQPFYIRVLELSLVGVVFGALFLRYGILASVAAHYTYNAAVSLPLLINGDWGARAGAAFAVGACLLLLLPALVRKMRGGRLEDKSAEEKAPVGSDGALWSPPMPVQRVRLHSLWGAHEPLAPMLLPLGSSHRSRWLAVPVGLAALALALVLVPLPPVLDRPLTRDEALARGVAAAAELDQPGDGLYGAAWPLDSLVNLDTRYLADHPGAQDPAEVAAREGLRASWYVRLSAWDRDDPLALWLDAEGRVLAFQRTLPEDAPGATLARPEALARAEELLRGQGVDPAVWELVDTATITRPLRVDHSFTWEHAAPLGEAGRPRVTVGVQGERVGLLSRHHFTPPEYRREREQTTLTTTLAQSLPALPALAGLALSAAALLLALRRPLPLHAMVAVGLTGGLAALLANLLRLAPADLAEPQRLIQSMSSAAYWAILAGSELALAYGCAAALRGKTTDHRPATTDHRPATTGGWWPPVGGLPLSLGLAALPALLTIEALNLGLTSLPGAALTPEGAGSWLPTLALLLQSGFDALRAALLLAGSAALIGTWRPLRTLAWPLVTLGAALAAVDPETTQGLLVVLPAWGLALLAAWALHGSLPALLLVLWLAAALPDALMLAMMSHPWHGLAGWAAIALLVGTVLALAARPAKGLPARPAAPPPPQG